MSSVRVADSCLSGALEVAAEYIQNGVRRATNDYGCSDCVRKTPKVLVVEHRDAGRSRQGLVVENVAVTADSIGHDRPYQTFLDGRGDGTAHGRDTVVEDGA